MNHIPPLIIDLGIILSAAGITTLLFKWLRQPLVLGYIIAGFLVGPNFHLFPTIADVTSVNTWAEIGIIFLHDLTEFERPVPLEELRANDVPFARNIVSGRRLTLTELATVFELGGLGVPEELAAEATQRYTP